MTYKEIITKLINEISPTGFEYNIQQVFKDLISEYVDTIYSDSLGNCFAEINGNIDKRVMINAHCDSVGFIIKYIDDSGFIYTDDLSGDISTDYRMLPGTEVLLNNRRTNKNIIGFFIQPEPIHKLDNVDLETSIDRDDLAIDIGASTQAEALKYVSVGDYVVFKPNVIFTDIGSRIIGTSLDDRIGLYCLIEIAKGLKKYKSNKNIKIPTIILTSTVCEENFIGAAKVAAINAKADISLTIDSTIATDQFIGYGEYTIGKKHGWIALNNGVVLSRGGAISDDIFKSIEHIALSHDIPYQIEIGGFNTEAQQIQASNNGVKTGLLSIPMRNLHTNIECCTLSDVKLLTRLLITYIKNIK